MNDVTREGTRFYMVWTKTGHPPRVAHPKLATARAEAQRLARLQPGRKFIVLQAIEKYGVPAPPPAEPCQSAETTTL